jgi:integrase
MTQRKSFTDANIAELAVMEKPYKVYDTRTPGLLVRVQPSGRKTFYYVYSLRGRMRWYRVGPVEMGAAVARTRTRMLIGEVACGSDPQSDRRAALNGITFEQLHARYLEEHAKVHNKSWRRADNLIRSYVMPRWSRLMATEIARSHVKALVGNLTVNNGPALANQVRASVSAMFTFAVNEEVVAVNPCKGMKENETNDRERILSDAEVPTFWNACEQIDPVRAAALRVILLTGQRPGEVRHMRREHIRQAWWEMPGKPVEEMGWPGTKNAVSHRVYLTSAVLDLIAETSDEENGFVFVGHRGKAAGSLDDAMRKISKLCAFDPAVTPHDLRRTMGSKITGRRHGRDAMDRILNHKKKSVTNVYDRHNYAMDDQRIMEDISAHVMRLIEEEPEDNVIAAQFRRGK